jgi:hypothetical protein
VCKTTRRERGFHSPRVAALRVVFMHGLVVVGILRRCLVSRCCAEHLR